MRYIARKHKMCKWRYTIIHEMNVLRQLIFASRFIFSCSRYHKSDSITGGETEEEMTRVDIMENQSMDFRNGFVRLCYADFVSPSTEVLQKRSVIVDIRATTHAPFGCFDLQEGLKPGYLKELPGKLEQFSKFLGERKWFAGDKVCEGLM